MSNIQIDITVNNAAANKKLAETDKHLASIDKTAALANQSTGQFETSVRKLGQMAAGVKALQVGFSGLTKFVGASVESFSAQEDAVKKLTTALAAQGQATPKVISQYQEMAASFQNTTVFADELIGEMQALLVQVGNVLPGDMAKALKASTDLAAGLGIDLRTATLLVGKAFAGETGGLARYGIVIDEAKVKSQGASVVLEALNAKFGGQAQAQLDTYSGKVAQLGNKMDDLRERLGDLAVRAVTPLLGVFNQLPGPIQDITLGLGALLATLGPIAFGFIAISNAIGPLLPLLFGEAGLVGALSAVGIGIGAVIAYFPLLKQAIDAARLIWQHWDEIPGIVQRVYDAVKLWLVDKFNAVVDSIKAKVDAVTGFFGDMYEKVVGHSFVPDMVKAIGLEFGKLDAVMVDPARTATGKLTDLFQGMTDKLAGMIGGKDSTFGKILHGGLGALFSAGGPLMSLVGMGMDAIGDLVLSGVKKIGGWIGGLFTGSQPNDERDAWFGGRSVQDIGDQLAPFMDGESARKLIESVFNSKNKKDFGAASGAIDKILGRAHTGGFIGVHGLERYHRGGLLSDERLIIGQTGEGVLNRRGMAALGSDGLRSLNAGGGATRIVVDPGLRADVRGLRGDINALFRQLPEQLHAAQMRPRPR